MPVLNLADAIYLGANKAKRAYLGSALVYGDAPTALEVWHNALADVDNHQARVLWIGDSIMEGTGASTRAKRALDLITAQLTTDYPVAGQGQSLYVPAVYGCPTSGQVANTAWGGLWATSTSGTVNQQLGGISGGAGTAAGTYGLGMRSVDLASANATATYTLYGTNADIWLAAGGSFQYSVDGGAYSVTINTAGMDANADIYPVSLGASGSHTLAIKCISGTVHLLGFTQFDGARDKGIAMFDACHWGAKSTDFYDGGTPGAAQNAKFTRAVQLVNPDLIVFNSGLNENYYLSLTELRAHYQGLITAAKAAAPSASCCMYFTYNQAPDTTAEPSGTDTYADWRAMHAQLATDNGMPMLGMFDRMPASYSDSNGYYYSDGQHMTDKGDALWAGLTLFDIDPVQSAPRVELDITELPASLTVDTAISKTVTATLVNGAAGPVTISAPSLPAGLSISATTGSGPYTATISGTPTTEATSTGFDITASTGTQSASKTWTATVNAASSGGITRIASGYVTNTGGGFDRSATIADIGPIPAGALIVVMGAGVTKMDVTDTAGNTYTLGVDGSSGWRNPSMQRYCLSAAASATNAFGFSIENNGGGVEYYMLAVEVYTGPGVWAYLAAQSGITELSYATANTVDSAPITTSAAGVVSGIAYSGNPSSGPVSRAWSPGDLIAAASGNVAGDFDAASGAYTFDAAISAQKITAGAGRTDEYKYIDLLVATFTNL